MSSLNIWEVMAKQLASQSTQRDTPCETCGKWTHRATPYGMGIVYCSENCKTHYNKKKTL